MWWLAFFRHRTHNAYRRFASRRLRYLRRLPARSVLFGTDCQPGWVQLVLAKDPSIVESFSTLRRNPGRPCRSPSLPALPYNCRSIQELVSIERRVQSRVVSCTAAGLRVVLLIWILLLLFLFSCGWGSKLPTMYCCCCCRYSDHTTSNVSPRWMVAPME